MQKNIYQSSDGSAEQIMKFPCLIEIKSIGQNSNELIEKVKNIIKSHLYGAEILQTEIRMSSNSRYQSVNCTIEAMNRAQLDAIYCDLNKESGILYLL